MTTFKKRMIPGTKSSITNGSLFSSTGNPSLDHILGGGTGIPIGSLILIEEDKYHTYSKVLLKYFLAEGVLHNHSLFVASLDDDPKDIIKKIPVAIIDPSKSTISSINGETNDLRIAWRYSDLTKVSTEQIPSNVGHNFDLSRQIDSNTVEQLTATLFDGSADRLTETIFQNTAYDRLIETLQNTIRSGAFNSSESNNLLRICLHSIGSPLWYSSDYLSDLYRFLTILKGLVRHSQAICFITMPLHLYNDKDVTNRIRNLVDYAIELESFAGSSKETNPIFKEYHGLLFVHKNGAVNSLTVVGQTNSVDLAFKLRRKKFIIETMHLPPELQEDTETVDKLSAGCGSTNKHLLEF